MSPPLGSYDEWQLARVATPRPALVDLVRRAASADVDRIDRILEGYSNEIYRVRCEDGQDLVVRILRFDDDVSSAASAGEAWAIEQARAARVPVPEILLLDTIDVDGSPFPVMVQRTVPGRPLGELIDRLTERQLYGVLVEIGGLVVRINKVHVEDGGNWLPTIRAELADLATKRDLITLVSSITAPEFDRMVNLLRGYLEDFSCERWVLCHGDLSLKHIFVTGGGTAGSTVQVSGIIDFGDWQPGALVHDLAVLRVRSPRLELAPLLDGYGTATDQVFRRQLDLHTLLIALDSLAFGVAEGDLPSVEDSVDLIRRLLADLLV